MICGGCFQSRFDPSVQIRGRGKPVLTDSYSVMQKKTWVITGKMCRWNMFGELQLLIGAGRCNAVCLVNEVIETESFSCRQVEIYEPGKACSERDLWREGGCVLSHVGTWGSEWAGGSGELSVPGPSWKRQPWFWIQAGWERIRVRRSFCVCKPYIYFRLSLTSVWLSSPSILK